MDTSNFDSSFNDGSSLLHLTQLEPDKWSYLPGRLVPSSPAQVPVLDSSRTASSSPFVLTCKFVEISFPTDSCYHALDLLTNLAQYEEMALHDLQAEEEEMAYLLKATKRDRNVCTIVQLIVKGPSPWNHIVLPRTPHYEALMKDPGFFLAQQAGTLRQSLVSQHVHFSSQWWNGAQSPPMGVAKQCIWNYVGRHHAKENHFLNGFVCNRGSAGCLPLHVIACAQHHDRDSRPRHYHWLLSSQHMRHAHDIGIWSFPGGMPRHLSGAAATSGQYFGHWVSTETKWGQGQHLGNPAGGRQACRGQ